MAKDVVFTFKLERELRDSFVTVAVKLHRPASQILRDLMRNFIETHGQMNAQTKPHLPW